MSYATQWRNALSSVKAAGVTVAFAQFGQSDITGAAIQSHGDVREYQRMGLTEAEAPTLFFVRDVFAVTPSLLDRAIVWGGRQFVVKSVSPTAPDGNMIAAKIVVGR